MKPYYEEGGIKIYHGDAREILFADKCVDAIITDPPYGNANQDGDLAASRVGVKGARKAAAAPIAMDRPEEYEPLMRGFFLPTAARILKPDSACVVFCGGGGPTLTFADLMRWTNEHLQFFHAIVWDKSDAGNGLGWRYRRNYELAIVSHPRGGTLRWNDDEPAVANIIRVAPVRNRVHPNEKPGGIVGGFIRRHTLPGDLILDPFMGSGTTLVEARELGRRAIGIELEERHCETAAKRLAQGVLFP